MRSKNEVDETFEDEELEGELITGPQEYTLQKPLIHMGERKEPGDKVVLDDQRAERLKGSGHI